MSLNGIEKITQLTEVNLSNNKLKNIDGLECLENL